MSFVSHSATMKYHDVYSYNLSPSFMAINHPSALWNDPFHVHPNIISLLISLIDSICPLFLVKAVKAPGFFLVKPPFGAPQKPKKTATHRGTSAGPGSWARKNPSTTGLAAARKTLSRAGGTLGFWADAPWRGGVQVVAICCKGKMARTPPNYGYFNRGWWSLKMMNQWMEWDVPPNCPNVQTNSHLQTHGEKFMATIEGRREASVHGHVHPQDP